MSESPCWRCDGDCVRVPEDMRQDVRYFRQKKTLPVPFGLVTSSWNWLPYWNKSNTETETNQLPIILKQETNKLPDYKSWAIYWTRSKSVTILKQKQISCHSETRNKSVARLKQETNQQPYTQVANQFSFWNKNKNQFPD